jgi:Right handed beta helix region
MRERANALTLSLLAFLSLSSAETTQAQSCGVAGYRDDVCPAAFGTSGGAVAAPGAICTPPGQRVINISGNAELGSALANAQCGDEILLSGDFSGDFAISKSCTANDPVVIRSSSNATFGNGIFAVNGQYIIVTVLQFNGGVVELRGSNLRISGNIFRDSADNAIRVVRGYDNQIDYNEISGAKRNGIMVNLDTRKTWVHHNYIHDAAGSGNGTESIRVLSGWDKDTSALIEHNLMERVDTRGESEAISVKTAGNTIRGNSLIDSPNTNIVNRKGINNTYDGNYISGSGGLNIISGGNTVINNVVIGGKIRLMAGNMPPGRDPEPGYSPATDTVVQNNVADRIEVGHVIGGRKRQFTLPAANTRLANNDANIKLGLQIATTDSGGSASTVAKPLRASEVGPAAGGRAACP